VHTRRLLWREHASWRRLVPAPVNMGAQLTRLDNYVHRVEPPKVRAYGACSLEGNRMCNEDAYLAFTTNRVSWSLFGVFDGHGGPEMAERCAENFPLFFWQRSSEIRSRLSSEQMHNAMIGAFQDAEADVLQEAREQGGLWKEQGTCAVVCAVTSRDLVVGNLGDSRAVLCDRRGLAICITRDHKVGDSVEGHAIAQRGGLLDEDGKYVRIPGQPSMGISVARSLGDLHFKNVEELGGKAIISAVPDMFHVPLVEVVGAQANGELSGKLAAGRRRSASDPGSPGRSDDQLVGNAGNFCRPRNNSWSNLSFKQLATANERQRFSFLLVCCDGIWDVMSDQEAVTLAYEELIQIVKQKKEQNRRQSMDGLVKPDQADLVVTDEDCERVCKKLGDEALERGSRDNITAVIVVFGSFQDFSRPFLWPHGEKQQHEDFSMNSPIEVSANEDSEDGG